MKEETLSDKINGSNNFSEGNIEVNDVKEFIKKLKEKIVLMRKVRYVDSWELEQYIDEKTGGELL